MMLATPRYRPSVPIVTASDGRPSLVISRPLMAPATTPTSKMTTKMTSIDQCLFQRNPSSALDMPMIEATERSISPLMMMSVIGRAMIAISPDCRPRLKRLLLVRNSDEVETPSTPMATTTTARPVSQRSTCLVAMRDRQPACPGSSGWPGWPGAVAASGGSALRSGSITGTPLAQRCREPDRDTAIQGDGQQQQESGDRLVPEVGDAEHVQGHVDGPEQQRPDGRADRAAAAAEDRHPADHDRRDDDQREVGAPRARIDRLVLGGPQHAADPGDPAAQGERVERAPGH